MAESQFDRDLRRVVLDQGAVEPPAALVEWMQDLPTAATVRSHAQARFLQPLAAAAVVVVVAAIGFGIYAGASPKPLPPGEPLTIVTEPKPPESNVCYRAGVSVVMRRSGSEVVFDGVGDLLTWPYGTKALLVDGKAELFSPEGRLVAVEGETISVGGGGGPDGRFHVCTFD